MITFLGLFVASFISVFLKAFQQRNVALDHYVPILPLSLLMSTADLVLFGTIAIASARTGDIAWSYILPMGIGGGLGCMLSMHIHHRVFKSKIRNSR